VKQRLIMAAQSLAEHYSVVPAVGAGYQVWAQESKKLLATIHPVTAIMIDPHDATADEREHIRQVLVAHGLEEV
jgi:hypothetical protein